MFDTRCRQRATLTAAAQVLSVQSTPTTSSTPPVAVRGAAWQSDQGRHVDFISSTVFTSALALRLQSVAGRRRHRYEMPVDRELQQPEGQSDRARRHATWDVILHRPQRWLRCTTHPLSLEIIGDAVLAPTVARMASHFTRPVPSTDRQSLGIHMVEFLTSRPSTISRATTECNGGHTYTYVVE